MRGLELSDIHGGDLVGGPIPSLVFTGEPVKQGQGFRIGQSDLA
jgi:hypothetical protein